MTDDKKFPKIRITKQARGDLEKLVRIYRKERGSNVSMSDIASELIVSNFRSKSNGNGGAHYVGKAPVSEPVATGEGEKS